MHHPTDRIALAGTRNSSIGEMDSETDFSSDSNYDEFANEILCGQYPAAVSV